MKRLNFKLLANNSNGQQHLLWAAAITDISPILPHVRATVNITLSNINNYNCKYDNFIKENLGKTSMAQEQEEWGSRTL